MTQTAVEEAKELVDKMKSNLFSDGYDDAKKCALVAVNKILKKESERCLFYKIPNTIIEYWQQVKNEIEKL